MATNKGNAVKKGLAVVAGIGAVVGAYFLYGTDAGKKKRKEIKGWMLKAKGEVLEKIEDVKDLSEEKYKSTVATVMNKYSSFKDKYGDDVALLTKELLDHWNNIKKHVNVKSPSKSTGKAKPKKASKK